MLLNTTHTLPDGVRLRIRLPQIIDREGLRALHERLGLRAEDFDVARSLRFDPRTEVVACATIFDGGAETVVGYGAIDLQSDDPHLLICDDAAAPGVSDALTEALREHAESRRAA